MKQVLNVFGIILAAMLSLALIPMLIVTPIWQGVSGLLDPDYIESGAMQIVAELDLSELSLDNTELMQELTNAGISPEAAQGILSSETLQQVIEPLAHDFALALTGSFESLSLTEAQLQQIAAEHRAELIEIIRLVEPENTAPFSDELLGQAIDEFLTSEAPALLSDANTALLELQAEMQAEYAEVLTIIQGPLVLTALLFVIAILALLIFLFRWPRQEGLLWLGIDAALAALPVLGIAFSFKSAQLAQVLADGAGVPDVFAPVLRHTGNTILIGGVILAAAAVLFIGLFTLLRDRRMKKQAAYADTAPVGAEPAASLPADSPLNDVAPPNQRSPWDNV